MKFLIFVMFHCGLLVKETTPFLMATTPMPETTPFLMDTTPMPVCSNDALLEHILRLERTVTELKSEMKHDKVVSSNTAITSTRVAFEARELKVNVPYTNNEVLKFDYVDMNMGGAFNQNSGTFQAPVNGSHFFWANVMSYDDKDFRLVLMKTGNQELARGYTGAGQMKWGTATINHLVQLKQGDIVWLTVLSADGVRHIDGGGYSNFGGFALYAE